MPIDPSLPYDDSNVFARILRGELPCRMVAEGEHFIAFHDINPQAPVHILVVPRGAYVSWDDFTAKGSEAEIAALMRAVGDIARTHCPDGYRLMINMGRDGHQDVPHLHVHVFGGQRFGVMIPR